MRTVLNNCYHIEGIIQSNHGSHLIIDNYGESRVTLSNNYIIGDINKAVGSGGKDVAVTATQVQAKSGLDFTKQGGDTSSVTYLLNKNNDNAVWAQGEINGELINDGYPYLISNH